MNGLACYRAQAVLAIKAERIRQVEAEGWTGEHDDKHTDGSLRVAAYQYFRARSGH